MSVWTTLRELSTMTNPPGVGITGGAEVDLLGGGRAGTVVGINRVLAQTPLSRQREGYVR